MLFFNFLTKLAILQRGRGGADGICSEMGHPEQEFEFLGPLDSINDFSQNEYPCPLVDTKGGAPTTAEAPPFFHF